MTRDATAQLPPRPDLDLTWFPKRIVRSGTRWYRAHRRRRGPWYFSSGGGRFDLRKPCGTCYLASAPEAAAREIIGPDFSASGRVPESLVHDRIVSQLELPFAVQAARITSERTLGYGVVGSELAAAADYDLSCRWAEAFSAAGFEGMWYMPRFSGANSRALAVFGDSGEATDYDVDTAPKALKSVVDEMIDLRVMHIPRSPDELDVLDAPQA